MTIIEALSREREIIDNFGRPLTLTHVSYGIESLPDRIIVHIVEGVLVNGRFESYKPTKRSQAIVGEELERLLASRPNGNDFRMSDAYHVALELERRDREREAMVREGIERVNQSVRERFGPEGGEEIN